MDYLETLRSKAESRVTSLEATRAQAEQEQQAYELEGHQWREVAKESFAVGEDQASESAVKASDRCFVLADRCEQQRVALATELNEWEQAALAIESLSVHKTETVAAAQQAEPVAAPAAELVAEAEAPAAEVVEKAPAPPKKKAAPAAAKDKKE